MSSVTRTGRPRDERVDKAIAQAALELMADHGIADLRMDAVAERAGVGKAAIYRRFRSKDDLVAAVVGRLVSEIAIPDTGSTAGELRVLMDEAVALYRDTLAGPLMPALVEAMRRDEGLRGLIREGFLTGGPLDERLAAGVVDLILKGYARPRKARARQRGPKASRKERSK